MSDAARPGALLPLITAGELAAGDIVVWRRRISGVTHTAIVDARGWMVTRDGRRFASPDACAKATAGYPCRGWFTWRTTTGRTLQILRDRAAHAATRIDLSSAAFHASIDTHH